MHYAAKVDRNQVEIVKALRAVGATVQHMHQVGQGCPDLLVGYRRQTYLLEVKDGKRPPSERKLTPDQTNWHRVWSGLPVCIVNNVDEALRAIGAKGRQS